MPRSKRHNPGGFVYHVLNRAVARLPLFQKDGDYQAFLRVLDLALEKHPMRILSYCLMPNHWHFVLWPKKEGELSAFVRWLTHTHTMRWHAHYHTLGTGHLYQGRFKAFPVAGDDHYYRVVRYVERNALRARLAARAEDWLWSSLYERQGESETKRLSEGPLPLPHDWLVRVHQPETEAELAALRRSSNRGTPFGDADWQKRTAKKLGLDFTLRPRGRPKKPSNE